MKSALEINQDELVLRFPLPEFHDFTVEEYTASMTGGSGVGRVDVRPWAESEIAKWRQDDRRYRSYGQHAATLIKYFNRDIRGDGLVQRLTSKLAIPLLNPGKTSGLVTSCTIDGRGWLNKDSSGIGVSL